MLLILKFDAAIKVTSESTEIEIKKQCKKPGPNYLQKEVKLQGVSK
jgi:hypothetical protein